ncbi:MAG: FeoB-associated Cys-rich membrane protein [Oscillospiraceae bacterium]|nr:FeoB-associated Cys-rich membrane protein [Oscillospiraceae bacterium]
MSVLDYLLLAAIIGYSAYLIFRKKKPSCSGNCAACQSGCKKH